MLDALIAVEDDAEKLASLALGHLRVKIPQLRPALEGKVRDHHRFLIQRLLLQPSGSRKGNEKVRLRK